MFYLIVAFFISHLINVNSIVCPTRHFQFNNTKCLKCPSNCVECSDINYCIKCEKNFCGSICIPCSLTTTSTTTIEIKKSEFATINSAIFVQKMNVSAEKNEIYQNGNHSSFLIIILLLTILITLMATFLLTKFFKYFVQKKVNTKHFNDAQNSTTTCLTKKRKRSKRKLSLNDETIFSNTFPTSSLNEGSLLLDQKEPLGKGQFGTVYKCPYVENCEYIWVAIKIANYTSKEASKEAAVLSKLSHLNIIKLKTVNMKNGLALVMPLRQSDLKTFVRKERDKISNYHQIRYCMQISDACRYMISQEFIHGDIKASNILVVDINHIEISDFGKSEMMGKGKRALGTTTHVAVELFNSRAFSCEATDVWSFGVTMWEIFNYGEKNPYEEELNCKNVKDGQLINYLSEGKRLNIPDKLNMNIQRAIQTCWLPTSSERPTFNQLFLTFSNSLPEGASYALNNVLEV